MVDNRQEFYSSDELRNKTTPLMENLVEIEWTMDTHLKELQRGPDPGNDVDA
jgi:hypothetical protein